MRIEIQQSPLKIAADWADTNINKNELVKTGLTIAGGIIAFAASPITFLVIGVAAGAFTHFEKYNAYPIHHKIIKIIDQAGKLNKTAGKILRAIYNHTLSPLKAEQDKLVTAGYGFGTFIASVPFLPLAAFRCGVMAYRAFEPIVARHIYEAQFGA